MKKFIGGLVTGITLVIIIIPVLGYFYTGPVLDTTIKIPKSAKLNRNFIIKITVYNPNPVAVTLDNVEIPLSVFDVFEIKLKKPILKEDGPISLKTPVLDEDEPLNFLGTKTWYFDLKIPPLSTKNILFEVQPKSPGNHVIKFSICNSTLECSVQAKRIIIQ